MHLATIAAFAVLFWRKEQPPGWFLFSADSIAGTLAWVWSQPLVFGWAACLAARHAQRRLKSHPHDPMAAQLTHHRASFLLRAAAVIGFASSVMLTPWPDICHATASPILQILGDVVTLLPYLASALGMWFGTFSYEAALRSHRVIPAVLTPIESETIPLRLRDYLDFQMRHQFLIVAAPMLMILFAANLIRGYERELREVTGWFAAADVLMGVIALGVFIAAPAVLRNIWRTRPLDSGPLRERLESLCRRIGLKVRDILIWNSDGMMINAAVMGVIAPVRYVLLSDGLLASMSPRQIEAVFGHEAGHVRHHHIQHFLLFGLVGWLLVAGVMELLARFFLGPNGELTVPLLAIEGVGAAATIAVWGIGFGWLSRRFERQADVFGASCVTPSPDECTLPCAVHPDNGVMMESGDRVCATGAAVFASALDRVAGLNGIPREERSWRHSSIGSRIRFLARLAGDPAEAGRFQRTVRRAKTSVMAAAMFGSIASILYLYSANGQSVWLQFVP